MGELNAKQRKLVAESARTWPRSLTTLQLLERLDRLAKAVLEAKEDVK